MNRKTLLFAMMLALTPTVALRAQWRVEVNAAAAYNHNSID